MSDSQIEDPIEKNKKTMDAILRKRDIQRLKDRAYAGEGEAIFETFALSKEDGGFADVLQDADKFSEAEELVNERLAGGEPNNWGLYESVGNQVRGEEPDQYQTEEQDRSEAINDMAAARRKELS